MKAKLLVALLGSMAAGLAMADVSGVMTVQLQGPGGHSNSSYGNTNAVHAASRAILEIEKAIPSQKQCMITDFNGGVSVNAIAANSEFKVTLNAKDDKELAALKAKVEEAVKKGVQAENDFRGAKPGKLTNGVPSEVRITIK